MKKNRQILVLAALLFSFLCFPADKVLAASNVVDVLDDVDAELLAKVLANPEMKALLASLAKAMK